MKKTSLITLILFGIFNTVLFSQPSNEVDTLLRSNNEVPKVLLVGTFHFGYPGLDAHKTDDAYKVDIKSPQKQKEVQELVAYIAKFKPTKIMVEAGANTGYLMNRYRDWKKGETELRKREVDQICFRLIDQFGLDTLYGVDAYSLAYQLKQTKDSIHAKPILDKIYAPVADSLVESTFDDKYWEWYDLDDKRCVDMNLLDYFKEMNSPHHINRMHGHYILSDKTTNYNAVDGLLLNWYSRNLRILKNIQNVETDSSDRILVLFGAGHIAILRQQFQSTPEYELVEFGGLGD